METTLALHRRKLAQQAAEQARRNRAKLALLELAHLMDHRPTHFTTY